jgi:hypothetical protein
MKRLPAIVCFVLLLASIPIWPATDAAGKPKMVIDQPTFDAGEVYRSVAKIEHTFLIKNVGTTPLNVLNATPG